MNDLETLRERVAVLESQMERLLNGDPDTWMQDFEAEKERAAFAALLAYLETLVPDFSARRFREDFENTQLQAMDRADELLPDHQVVSAVLRVRLKEVISDMFSHSIFDGAPAEIQPPSLQELRDGIVSKLRERLSSRQE